MFGKILKKIEFIYFQVTFFHNFEFYISEDKDELNELYKIRYQVYCEEFGYLEKEEYPNKVEYDIFDSNSVHFILRHRKSKEVAATVRLILNSNLRFPIEKHFTLDLQKQFVNNTNIAEISRLIVAKKYRKKLLLISLIKGLFSFIWSKKIDYIYAVLDDKLFKTVKKMGFPFKKIGAPSVYQGFTTPYIINVQEMMDNLYDCNPRLLKYILNGVVEFHGNINTYSTN